MLYPVLSALRNFIAGVPYVTAIIDWDRIEEPVTIARELQHRRAPTVGRFTLAVLCNRNDMVCSSDWVTGSRIPLPGTLTDEKQSQREEVYARATVALTAQRFWAQRPEALFVCNFWPERLELFCFASIQLRPVSDHDMLTVGRSARDLLRKKFFFCW